MPLTSPNRRSENIRVLPIVVAELEFSNVERHVFAADLMEGADDAALEDRPKAFNRVGMDCSDYVLALGVVDDAMGEFVPELPVGGPLVGAK